MESSTMELQMQTSGSLQVQTLSNCSASAMESSTMEFQMQTSGSLQVQTASSSTMELQMQTSGSEQVQMSPSCTVAAVELPSISCAGSNKRGSISALSAAISSFHVS